MSYVAVGVVLLGTAINYENQQQTANKADRTQAQAIQQQTALQQKGNVAAEKMLQKDQANNTDTSQRSQLLDSFQKAIAANEGTATGSPQVGAVSSAYTKAANDAALGVSQYAGKQAGNLADMGAPMLQRQGENANLAQYGSTIGGLSQQSAADQGLADIKMRGIQANPWLAAVGNGLTSYGMSTMGGGMMTGGNSALGQANGAGPAAGGAFGGQVGYQPAQGFGSLYNGLGSTAPALSY